MFFELQHTDTRSAARAGVVHTDHGDILTPIFMPVGTVGTVKGVHFRDLYDDIKAQIILGNTYHLYLRPGTDILRQAGGLHRFEGWTRPILTDSGGFQVFSLAGIRKMKEEGVTFSSHIDGRKLFFTPENVMDIERLIGADIMMAFDECTPGTADYNYAKASMERTLRWLDRCIERFDSTEPLYGYRQHLFPIVQGCVYPDLRREAAKRLRDLDRDGYAIGGLAVGEPEDKMYEMIEVVNDILPHNKPRYLMGVGTPWNILQAIERGVDMFDCVMPTRNGRNGMIFTRNGVMNMRNKKWENDFTELDPDGTSFVDHTYTRAYVRHLIHAGEMLGLEILSIHNLAFYLWLVTEARKHIIEGDYKAWKEETMSRITQRL
ncbi:MAG: tRNA guanosine(34) transglycosylase Tgt [Paludibacter sp.]|nr:tRNA guanosine(34) transglycosylase Tgt [Bacteroidales bacterium]MCM1069393.1 tRNA guanosine(34) transglycosylase Tgt [Prevotella sp.]MCM1353913.1 tRNA guanosine(34) transglycosylase Tgt [Bacteroides sp.]MCM1442837.1 tRNA guanosine(34) transglycosylase Tgt [Muribaculum sp.]MCM1481882.1 tRNA guanosine(34) transglycosylase Tgt [Paludibacter sp.]